MAEAHAQLFFFTQIKANPNSTIRIPEISHAWEKPGGLVYIVLEHIDIEHFASDEQRSQAITELISIKPPPGRFGGFSGERIRHPFSNDGKAYIISGRQLEAFVNRVSAALSTDIPTSRHCDLIL